VATYKVIQDIEAEDKLLGPLTLKQFIFAGIAFTCAYLSFLAITRGAIILVPFLLPPTLMAAFFAWPWSRDQPTEIWAIARLRFLLKPRRRIWDQSGVKELVTITVPKQANVTFANNLTQTEVKSRLQALANTIDSRGWAVKNVNVNLFAQPSYVTNTSSDRLIDPSSLPQEVSGLDITAGDDILDERNNPTAQHLDQMIVQSSQAYMQQVRSQMQSPTGTTQPTNWFTSQTQDDAPIDDEAVLDKIHAGQTKAQLSHGHLRTLRPHDQEKSTRKEPETDAKKQANNRELEAGDKKTDPALQELAKSNDLNVSTIARQADKRKRPPEDEVVVSWR